MTVEEKVALVIGRSVIQVEALRAEIDALRNHIAALEAEKTTPPAASSDGVWRNPGIYEADQPWSEAK